MVNALGCKPSLFQRSLVQIQSFSQLNFLIAINSYFYIQIYKEIFYRFSYCFISAIFCFFSIFFFNKEFIYLFIKPLFYTSLLEINWKLFFLTPWDYFFNQVKICLFFTFNFSFLTWVVHLYLFLLPSIKEHELKLKQIKITFLLFYFILNNVLFYFYLLPSYWKFFFVT